MNTLTVTNLKTGRVHEIPYTPYPDLKEGDLYIRLPSGYPVLLSQLPGHYNESTGLYNFPEGYPQAMTRRGFPVYRRRERGGDECMEIEDPDIPLSHDAAAREASGWPL